MMSIWQTLVLITDCLTQVWHYEQHNKIIHITISINAQHPAQSSDYSVYMAYCTDSRLELCKFIQTHVATRFAGATVYPLL